QLFGSGGDQYVVADDPHRVGADTPFGFHCGGTGGELEAPLMPRAIDEFVVPHHYRITGYRFVDHSAATCAAGAQGAAFVRAVVGDGVEGSVDVVDAHAVPSDRHHFRRSGRDLVHGRDDMFSP